jgi:ankyrin repeat protein
MYKKEEWIKYIEINNIEAIKYLLYNKLIYINIQDNIGITPLMFASLYNNIEMVKLLLNYKDINVNHQNNWNNTALIIASRNNNIEIVKILLNHPDINIFLKDNCDKTALDYAKERNYKEIETLLINHIEKINNKQINRYKKEEWTNYICGNNIEAIKYLLNNNLIDINIQDNIGTTPLMYASYCNNIEILKILLSYKDINVNHQNKWKNTALILASCWNNIEIVKILLNHPDINIFLKGGDDKTALDWAKKRNNKEIETLLTNKKLNNPSDTIEKYNEIQDKCYNIFKNKAIDYGTSWRILRSSSLTDQIYIKAKRIREIQENKYQKVNDDIQDDYIGIINYSIMALIQLSNIKHELSIDEILNLYIEKFNITKNLMIVKNSDYGEAWKDLRLDSIIDLILMKLLRIKQIENNDNKTIISEGLDANYMDIINYCIFSLIKINNK